MEAQDILKSLSKLEHNLKNIESAERQVTDTVNAYKGAKNKLSDLCVDFKQIHSELDGIMSKIRTNQDLLVNGTSEKVCEIFDKINLRVLDIENSSKFIQANFALVCSKSGKEIEKNVDVSIHKFEYQSNAILEAFQKNAKSEIVKIESSFIDLKKIAKETCDMYIRILSESAVKQKEIQEISSSKIHAEIDKQIRVLNQSQSNFEKILSEYKNQSDGIVTQIVKDKELIRCDIMHLKSEFAGVKEMIEFQFSVAQKDMDKKLAKVECGIYSNIKNLNELIVNNDNQMSDRLDILASKNKKQFQIIQFQFGMIILICIALFVLICIALFALTFRT